MSSKIFQYAQSAYTKAEKNARKSALSLEPTDVDKQDEIYKMVFDTEIIIAKNRFNKILELSEELHEQFLTRYKKNWLFITIRPDESKLTFYEFSSLVNKFVNRKCIKTFTLSYEQKGISSEALGNGFHCHIVCDTTWRSKGEALRDTLSTFKKICAPNCIQIDKTNNPDNIIEKYLIEYESKDEHKHSTKEWDTIWREQNGIQELYTDENVEVHNPRLSSPKDGGTNIDPFYVKF